jgi:hypothetical protein
LKWNAETSDDPILMEKHSSQTKNGMPRTVTAYPPRTSEILAGLVAAQSASHQDILSKVTVGELMAALRNRAFGLSLIMFGMPNILPLPMLPVVFGTVLAIIALQIAFGRESPWLPGALSNRSVSRKALASVINRTLPWVRWIERVSRPRFPVVLSQVGRRAIGLTVFILALLLIVLPIPWIGSMPQGIAITLFGLGLAERDGFLVVAGYIFSGIAFVVGAAIGLAVWYGALLIF